MKKEIDFLAQFAKTRGFFFLSSEIYDGFAGVYDYGPLGVELVNNIKKNWWNNMVRGHSDIVGLDSAICMSPRVWSASGHIKNFSDPYVICGETGERLRADTLLEEAGVSADGITDEEKFTELFDKNKKSVKLPDGCKVENLSKVSFGNLLVSASMGTENDFHNGKIYLRGETCQGIYVNYKNIAESMRLKVPFGIGQIGKAFRNEISPRQFLFRTREFEQMELQYFVHPKDAKKYYDQFKKERFDSLCSIGLSKDNLRFKKHENPAFYASEAEDIEYNFPSFGWKEIEGIHNRGDHDLSAHSKESGISLDYLDPETNEKFIPHVIETSAGVGRMAMALLFESVEEEKLENNETRLVSRFAPSIAPITVAVLPLSKNKKLNEQSKDMFNLLKKDFSVWYDETQSIGKRYRRQDEIGTPFCVTVDFETENDKKVTIRQRDSMSQDRVDINDVVDYIKEKIG
ncbi:MAG: glycine--tRNA ligase [Candidatus Campbellbacteria bacterium]|nr:glycine--tRNA ligase [Candidatus Campbellbacteria bacterium]